MEPISSKIETKALKKICRNSEPGTWRRQLFESESWLRIYSGETKFCSNEIGTRKLSEERVIELTLLK